MTNEDQCEHRGRCIDAAVRSGAAGADIVPLAASLYAFVIGGASTATAGEVLDADPAPAKTKAKAKTDTPAPDLAAPQEHSVDDAKADDTAVTYPQVQAAVVALAKAKGRQAVLDAFKDFDVDHATKLTEGQWAPFIAAAEKALG